MAEISKIKNVKSLLRKLEKLERVAHRRNTGNVAVGYNASYALYVHENVEMRWKGLPRGAGFDQQDGIVYAPKSVMESGKIGRKRKRVEKEKKLKPRHKGNYWGPQGRGQAKFLEQPARELRGEMQRIIYRVCARGAGLIQALLMAGMFLQRESQKLVPVDTGNLKGSAFTEKE